MTRKEFFQLKKKYNTLTDLEKKEKYREYRKKMEEIMMKPPNDKNCIRIGINELVDDFMSGSRGYFYNPDENIWCVYEMYPIDRSNDISFIIHAKKETEEEAFQHLYMSFSDNVKRHEREMEREKNDHMTQDEFLEWYGKENRKEKLEEKGPYQILWNRRPEDETYAVGYYLQVNEANIDGRIRKECIAYVMINGKCKSERSFRYESRAIYMMRYWIQRIIEGHFD